MEEKDDTNEKKSLIDKEITQKNFKIEDFIDYIKQVKKIEQINFNNWTYEEIEKCIKNFQEYEEFQKNANEVFSVDEINNNNNNIINNESQNINANKININNNTKIFVDLGQDPIERKIGELGSNNILDDLSAPSGLDDTIQSEINSGTTIHTKKQSEGKLTKGKYTIKVTNFEITKGIFNYSYLFFIESEELNVKTGRTYNDFEWIKKTLEDFYPTAYIPPLPKIALFPSNNELIETTKFLDYFINFINQNKLLRSTRLYEYFIFATTEDFQKVKDYFKETKKPNSYKKIFTIEGEITVETSKEKEDKAEQIKEYMSNKDEAFKKIEICLNDLMNEIEIFAKKIKSYSFALEKLSFCYIDNRRINKLLKNYSEYFKYLGDHYLTQKNSYDIEFRQFFKWVDICTKDFVRFYDDYDKAKYTLLTEYIKKNDKVINLTRVETKYLNRLRKNFGFTLNRLIEQYNFLNDEVLINFFKNQINVFKLSQSNLLEKLGNSLQNISISLD